MVFISFSWFLILNFNYKQIFILIMNIHNNLNYDIDKQENIIIYIYAKSF